MVPMRLSFLYLFNPKDMINMLLFLLKPRARVSFFQRLGIVRCLYATSLAVDCRHAESEIISFMETVLSLPDTVPGCVVEAGCYRGGSTAKISIAAGLANRELVVFDSFEGLPEHDESTNGDIFGSYAHPPGSFSASLDEVTGNVDRYGELKVCEFIKGWFDATMPEFSRPVSAALIDVNLASSTRTCLKYLYPRLGGGGTLISNDGYSAPVCDVFRDDRFWQEEVGHPRPHIKGLGKRRVIKVVKPLDAW